MTSAPFPNLDGLDGLSRQTGVDTRPTLVRVLTDLYIQKPEHTPDEERHYTELVLRLLDVVDAPTRAIVAKKLARYAAAPLAVMRRLAHDVFEVAEPVLKHADCLSGADLIAIIRQHDARYAAAIASRRSAADAGAKPAVPATPAAREAAAQQPAAATPAAKPREIPLLETAHPPGLPLRGPIRTMAGPAPLSPPALTATNADSLVPAPAAAAAAAEAQPSPTAAPASMPAQPETDNRLGEAFLKASSTERRTMLTNLEITPAIDSAAPAEASQGDAIRRLETAALQRRADVFIRELEHALGVTHEHARQVVQDEAGEPLLVCAKALAIPSNVLLRILLFLNPVIGNSVRHVFDLAQLYDRMSARAARQITASLRIVTPARRGPAMHRPLLWNDDADAGRRAAGEAARRQLGAPESGSAAPRRESLANLLAGRRRSS